MLSIHNLSSWACMKISCKAILKWHNMHYTPVQCTCHTALQVNTLFSVDIALLRTTKKMYILTYTLRYMTVVTTIPCILLWPWLWCGLLAFTTVAHELEAVHRAYKHHNDNGVVRILFSILILSPLHLFGYTVKVIISLFPRCYPQQSQSN
jgi:hypothetical protein